MKRLLLCGAALAVLLDAGSAMAADMAVKAPVMAPAAFSWTGFYVGGNVGGTWADDPSTYVGAVAAVATTFTVDMRAQSVIGGLQIGGNWQTGMLVLGAEADFDGRDLNFPAMGVNTTFIREDVSQREGWLGTARGRIGLAEGRALFYVTGGLAYGEVEHSFEKTYPLAGVSLGASDSTVRAGWTAGGGIEYALWKNLIVGAEYLHVDLGTTELTVPSLMRVGVVGTASFVDRSDIVRVRVDWLFGAPVM